MKTQHQSSTKPERKCIFPLKIIRHTLHLHCPHSSWQPSVTEQHPTEKSIITVTLKIFLPRFFQGIVGNQRVATRCSVEFIHVAKIGSNLQKDCLLICRKPDNHQEFEVDQFTTESTTEHYFIRVICNNPQLLIHPSVFIFLNV